MGQAKVIQHMLIDMDITQAEIARRIGAKPVNFYAKMERDDFRESDLRKIADAMNCNLEIRFIPKDNDNTNIK